jgi:hypothetical protein
VDDQPWDVGGGWTTLNCQVPEGTLFKLFVTRKRTQRLPDACAVLYRVRAAAPLKRLTMEGINLRHSSRGSITPIFGRVDRLSVEEAKAYGYKSRATYEKFFDSTDEQELLRVTEEAPGVAAAPVSVEEVRNSVTGEVSYLVKKVELRRIRRRQSD